MPSGLLCYVHRELGAAMVASGIAEVHDPKGKGRSIELTQPASSRAVRIGEPGGRAQAGVPSGSKR
jgi:hypothetical protein